jgi:hypothetical protein
MLNQRSPLGRFLIVCSVLACAGCQAPKGQWTKAGATEQQLTQDLQTCDETAAQWGAAPYFDPRRGPKDASQTQAACMMRRGWALAP